jgi:enoyl-CoA hydratase/3-hydroxyacyl-CoA dehydrogenase
MAYQYRELKISKLGVIGSGQIGPDIALHFAKVLHADGVEVVVVDVATDALERGQAKLTKKIDKGVESKAFRPEMAAAMKASVTFTSDYQQLAGAEFIVEAATEDCGLKQRIFGQLETLCAPGAVLASNSSHLEPDEIFEKIADRSRCLVIHYFFPAERNPAVELIPGKATDPKLVHSLMSFYEQIGKVPIRVGSRYGYAVDPIFEGLFLASALCVEQGLGSVREVDQVGRRALGLTVGSFTAMNLTGGNPITDHGLDMEHDRLHAWFRSPKLMKDAIAAGAKWEVAGRGETVEIPAEREQKIAEALQGAYFGLAGQAVDAGITNVADLEMVLEIALDIKPPFSMMNAMGVERALALVEAYAKVHPEFPVPACIRAQAGKKAPFVIQYVRRHDLGDVAWVRIRRPKVLNALNPAVFAQLLEVFSEIERDAKIKAAVLSGFGTKAFVSGADIGVLARLETPEQGAQMCRDSRRAGDFIETMKKPVVCALNGFALGGGIELAMCCADRLVARGLSLAASQPEVNLGVIPGAGGTQRLPRLIGVKKAAELMRTARPLGSAEGVALGLFSREVEQGELIDEAVDLARAIAAGKAPTKHVDPSPVDVPERLDDVELGHLSKAIDAILVRTILEGCAKPLTEGLEFESVLFGECLTKKDSKIGLTNFLEKGARSKAGFVHA